MIIDDATAEQQESIQEINVSECIAESEAQYLAVQEAMYVSNLYNPLIKHYEAVEERNKAIIEGNMEAYLELTEELEGENCGDC